MHLEQEYLLELSVLKALTNKDILIRLDDRHIRGSTASDLKLPPESDTDSIADYADGENAGNEKKFEFFYFSANVVNKMLIFFLVCFSCFFVTLCRSMLSSLHDQD